MRKENLNIKTINDSVIKLFVKSAIWDQGIVKINDITIQQIKSTGGMNLIRSDISNLISKLDMSNQELRTMEHYTEAHGEETIRLMYELADIPSIFLRMSLLIRYYRIFIQTTKRKL